jgi:hypothetical protein
MYQIKVEDKVINKLLDLCSETINEGECDRFQTYEEGIVAGIQFITGEIDYPLEINNT